MPFDAANFSETALPPIAAHLLRAKQYIEEHGWCQGNLSTSDGRVCMEGALQMQIDLCDYHVYDILITVTKKNISVWNDAHGRTLDEVLAAFDQAIALAIKEGE